VLLNSHYRGATALLYSRISRIHDCNSVRYCSHYHCCGCGMCPASSCHLWWVSSLLNFWVNIIVNFIYFVFICIQLNFYTYIIDIYLIYFNCYVTSTTCPQRYLLYDIVDYWLPAVFCNPQLITLNSTSMFLDLFLRWISHSDEILRYFCCGFSPGIGGWYWFGYYC